MSLTEATLSTALGSSRLAETDLLERTVDAEAAAVPAADAVVLALRPFQPLTLRFARQ